MNERKENYKFLLMQIMFMKNKNIIIMGKDAEKVKELQLALGDALRLERVDKPEHKEVGANILSEMDNKEVIDETFRLRSEGYKNMISVVTNNEEPFDELIKVNGEETPLFEYLTDYIITYREKNTIQIWEL